MKSLLAPRAIKGIDQVADGAINGYPVSGYPGGVYVPLADHQRWTGMQITPEVGLSIITAYQCVNLIASTWASIPTLLYRRLPGGGKERAENHPLYRTFAIQANPDMSAYTWKQVSRSHIETWGNAYSDIRAAGDGSVELWPIRPDRIEVYWDGNGRKAYDYLHPTKGRQPLNAARIFHLMSLTTDGLVGIPPITAMRRALGLYRKAEQYGEAVFDNGARPAVMMTHPKTLSDPAVKRLGTQMDELRGSGNAGKTVILEEGLEVHEIGFPPEDAQFMETRLFQKREIAAGFGVPRGFVNDPESNESEDQESRKFMKRKLVPSFEAFEQDAQLQVIQDPDYFVEFLADAYLRGDPKARADAYAVAWEHGALNGDEWRKRENLDPLPDGLGETYYRPANWVPLGAEATSGAQPVGGDASAGTQFGASPFGGSAALVDQVTRSNGTAKAADLAQFDCPDCGKLVARLAAPGSIGYCRGCKSEKTFEADGVEFTTDHALKAAALALLSREPAAPQVHIHEGAFKGGDIHVPATTIAEGAVQVTVAPPEAAPPPIVRVTVPEAKPTRKRVERDEKGRITGITEENA